MCVPPGICPGPLCPPHVAGDEDCLFVLPGVSRVLGVFGMPGMLGVLGVFRVPRVLGGAWGSQDTWGAQDAWGAGVA